MRFTRFINNDSKKNHSATLGKRRRSDKKENYPETTLREGNLEVGIWGSRRHGFAFRVDRPVDYWDSQAGLSYQRFNRNLRAEDVTSLPGLYLKLVKHCVMELGAHVTLRETVLRQLPKVLKLCFHFAHRELLRNEAIPLPLRQQLHRELTATVRQLARALEKGQKPETPKIPKQESLVS